MEPQSWQRISTWSRSQVGLVESGETERGCHGVRHGKKLNVGKNGGSSTPKSCCWMMGCSCQVLSLKC